MRVCHGDDDMSAMMMMFTIYAVTTEEIMIYACGIIRHGYYMPFRYFAIALHMLIVARLLRFSSFFSVHTATI